MTSTAPPPSDHSYDIVIVGGGPSALGLLRGLLERIPVGSTEESEAPNYTIAVIDRGKATPSLKRRNVQDWYSLAHSNENVLESVPQVGLLNRIIDAPVGSSLGGGTNINAMLVTKPSMDDFENWSGRWKGGHLLMDACNSMVDCLENAGCCIVTMDEEFKRQCCCKTIETEEPQTFREAVDTTNCFPRLVSSVPMAMRKTNSGEYRRISYYEALIHNLLQERPELRKVVTFYTNVQAQLIRFNNTRATGVRCTVSDTSFEIVARKQVILSCGAIYTPALLMASGIGDLRRLESLGIAPVQENKGVGGNLRDHVLVPRLFLSWQRPGVNSKSAIRGIYNLNVSSNHDKSKGAEAESSHRFQFHILDGSILCQIFPFVCASVFRVDCASHDKRWLVSLKRAISNSMATVVKAAVTVLARYTPIGYMLRYHAFGYTACLLNPVSTGTVSLQRKDNTPSTERPSMLSDFDVLVDPGYLSNQEDVKALESGFEATNTLDWFRREDGFIELCPGWLFRTLFPFLFGYTGWLRQYIAACSCPYFHWCGTCAIGDVVNDELQVRGVDGLRVCDASVFLNCLSCPTSLTCAALGYATAPLVIKDCAYKGQ